MLLALTPANSFGYRFFFFLHILAIVVAFAPAFVWPLLGRQRRAAATPAPLAPGESAPPPPAPPVLVRILSPAVHGGALVLAGLFGIAMVGMSNDVIEMSQAWISIAFLLWFLMIALFFLGLLPTEKKIAAGGETTERGAALDQRLSMLYGAMHLLLLLQVINMVWQVGLTK